MLHAERSRSVLDGAGRDTEVWRFTGKLLRGPSEALVSPTAGYLGPTIRARQGQRVRIRFDNALPEPSIVHWHGLDVSAANDGHPRDAIGPSSSYVYDFTVAQRAGTYWYHPHPHQRTGAQVYMGLAGLFIVDDPDELALGLPSSEQQLTLVLQDRIVGSDGELVYDADPMVGLLGDRVFVNGVASTPIRVGAGSHRIRILNGSNARIFKLAWSDRSPMTVIGTDGGLLAAPIVRPYVMLGPGERIDLWADFATAPGGDDLWLDSLAFDAGGSGMMGMRGGMMGMRGGRMGRARSSPAPAVANGAPLRLVRFVVRGSAPRLTLPDHLIAMNGHSDAEVVNRDHPKRFDVEMAMMQWRLNGRPFEMDELASNERIRLGAIEDWEFRNLGGMMTMPHPIHLHGGQFQIIERNVDRRFDGINESVREGLIDQGWKDTFLLMPGDRVRIRLRFQNHAGLFMYHCHNLEHEDMGMMRNFLVEA